ncbi:MAG: hypothetical protein ACLPX1_15110 [Steroidobacteraceae bacterium]
MSEAPISRRVLERMRRQVRSKVMNLAAFREGNALAETLQASVVAPETLKELHPAHALYTHVQNQMSVMAEQLLELPEMKAFAKIIGEAQEEYMPSWPPMSPISTSYFWCWSNFDAAANAHRETLGSVTLRIAAEFGVHPNMLTIMKAFIDSRMGVYRVEGRSESQVQLSDLVTDQRCSAICESGYAANVGELWFARVLPPPLPGQSDHVVFTSPYVLIAPDATGWTQYFDRIAAKDPRRPRIAALERHLKWGTSKRYWAEFVFEGYVNHRPGAIYLEGLPDVPESRPHSREYVGHADEH